MVINPSRSQLIVMESRALNEEVSPYELRRIDNIKRNNARLRELGLISSFEEKRSNAIACGIRMNATSYQDSDNGDEDSESEGSDDKEWNDESAGDDSKRKRKRRPIEQREGFRKSRRLKGEKAEYGPNFEGLFCSDDLQSLERERKERVHECRQARLRAANAIAACGGEDVAKKNPTATYGHCLMRVKTMTEKALVNRVKAIERAAGKHCVVKMAIFKSCLQDEGMWELAEAASAALERLKALKSIPEE